MATTQWILMLVVAYLVGTIPFGLLLGKLKGVDIRQHGSRNIGATNCGRVCGRAWGLLCFLLDVLKGLVPVLVAGAWLGWLGAELLGPREAGMWLAVAMAAVLGHVFPVWLKFKGGKGVATGFGAIVGVWPFLTWPALAAILTWVLFAVVFRYVSLASVVGAVLLPVYFLLTAAVYGWPLAAVWPFAVLTAAMVVLIVARHRGNLVRLWKGEENRLGGAPRARSGAETR